MNKGLKLATGEIIGILNSDDFYADDNVIKEVVEEIKNSGADCLWGNLIIIDRNNPDKVVRFWKSSPYSDNKFKIGWHPPHTTFFVRKKVYDKYGFFNSDFKIAADYELMLRFLEKFKISSAYIPEILIKMRTGGTSAKNIKNIIKANIETYRAWKVNGLKISFLRILLKPLSKILQFVKNNK